MGLMKNLGISNKGGGAGIRVKALFFDRKAVLDSLSKAEKRVLPKFGAFVRRAARSSIKAPRQKRVAELSAAERKSWRISTAIAKRKGRRPPRRPPAASRPGEPPRNQTGKLKNLLFFSWDSSSRSVVIGPEAFTPNKADVLEYGGITAWTGRPDGGKTIRVAPRPFMGPALAKEQPKLPAMWRDAMKP